MRRFPALGLVLVASLLGSCEFGHHESLPSRLAKKTDSVAEPIPQEVLADLSLPKSVPTRWRGESARDFQVAQRHSTLRTFPCTQCHTGNFVPDGKRDGPQKAHWDMDLHHAGKGTMDCFTCHAPEDGMTLRTLRGDTVGFDHAYQLCAQCHSSQAKDWSIGAHGKREGGWAGDRVVRSCTGCHNPHDPAFDTRLPAIAPMEKEPKHATHALPKDSP
jgi:hypothetical protein